MKTSTITPLTDRELDAVTGGLMELPRSPAEQLGRLLLITAEALVRMTRPTIPK